MENDRLKQSKLCFDDAEFEKKEFFAVSEKRSTQHDRTGLNYAQCSQMKFAEEEGVGSNE